MLIYSQYENTDGSFGEENEKAFWYNLQKIIHKFEEVTFSFAQGKSWVISRERKFSATAQPLRDRGEGRLLEFPGRDDF